VAGELQAAVVPLVARILGADLIGTPGWLLRPGLVECGKSWKALCAIYTDLTGLTLPEQMPPRETRRVDAVLDVGDGPRILEVDETQHFNRYRAVTLRHYPPGARVAYPVEAWIEQSEKKTRLEGGGFGKPKPPLFPAEYGRHQQRAFRDTLADLLPLEHCWAPTLRIGDFEVLPWIYSDAAEVKMRELLAVRAVGAAAAAVRQEGERLPADVRYARSRRG
jgi:hypothetical protein